MITELKPNVYWVGVTDWESRLFHGHELSIHRGTSYNAYLIVDEKIALVDTVWSPFRAQLMANIRQIVDPAKIDVIVTNHSEVDHAGALPEVLASAVNARVLVSRKGLDSVPGHFHADWKLEAVKTGDQLSLGRHTLHFIEAPMLHWPDSMFTYVEGANLLLSNDAFGQHYASAFQFNDLVDREELYQEALKYYANILTPFSPLVIRKIEEVLALGVPVDMIAPSHGIIWREDPLQIVTKYAEWARQKPAPRAVIVYDTMWQATRRMADAIGRGLGEAGVEHKIFHAATSDRNDVLTEIFQAGAVILGSPTLNNGLLPTIWPLLQDLKGLKFRNKLGGVFGSYGWSGEGNGQIEAHLDSCAIPCPVPSVRCKWQPDDSVIKACETFGRDMARELHRHVRTFEEKAQ